VEFRGFNTVESADGLVNNVPCGFRGSFFGLVPKSFGFSTTHFKVLLIGITPVNAPDAHTSSSETPRSFKGVEW